MAILRTVATIAIVGLVAACGTPAPPEGNFAAQDVGGGSGGGIEDTGSDADGSGATVVETMDGTWLHYDQVVTCVNFIGFFEQLTNYLHIVRVTQNEDGSVEEEWQACNTQLSPVFGLQPRVDPRLYDTGFPFTTDTGAVTGTDIGDTYTSGVIAVLWGLVMDDRVGEDFPTETDDPRIQDVDGDGNPGNSLIFNNGDCISYLAQRAINSYEGTFVAPDRIEGGVVGSNEQIVVGGTGSLCQVSYDTWFPPERNRFTRIRIDGQGGAVDWDADGDGEITCAEVVGEEGVLTFGDDAILNNGRELIEVIPFNHNCCDPMMDDPGFPECPVETTPQGG